MSEDSFISIVIPTYNNDESLKKTVESLYGQSYPKDKYEIIIVDDGSTDNTRKYVEFLQEKYCCDVKYFFQKNRGPSSARNLGIKNTRGDIIAFIDSDCIATENWIEEITKGYENNRIAGIGGTIKSMPVASKVSQYCAYTRMNEKPKIDKTGIVYLITGNASFKKDCLIRVGGFDEHYDFPGGEDPDICYRLRRLGYFFQHNSNAIVYNPHKETLGGLLKTYFNYGKGESFLTLRKMSSWDLISISGIKCFFYLLKAITKMALIVIGNLKFIIRFFKIPFKALLYYAEGLNMKDAFAYAFLDYVRIFSFAQGVFIGYIIGKFKGFKKTSNNCDFL